MTNGNRWVGVDLHRRRSQIAIIDERGATGGGPLRAQFERIATRRGPNIAKVAIARQILTLCYYGLRDGEIRCLNHQPDIDDHDNEQLAQAA